MPKKWSISAIKHTFAVWDKNQNQCYFSDYHRIQRPSFNVQKTGNIIHNVLMTDERENISSNIW